MAGGYLGKISAVIAANTGDYVRGLNEGAKATRDFAKSVQSTLTRSASDAAKAFEGIYTPLQQVERALRQASKLRLNFAGFEGAVKNITDLQRRLDGVLSSAEIDLIVRTSGLKDIEAVRTAIGSISQKEITLTANAGGLAGLLKERARLEASGETSTKIINTKATRDEIDALIAKLRVIDDTKIDLIIDIVNQRGLDEAIARTRLLQDAATQLAAPLSAAASEFNKLSQAAQGQFAPALGAAQGAVERFKANIDQIGPAGRRAFADLKADVDLVRNSISRLSEGQALTGGLLSESSLSFVDPRVVDTLNRVREAQRSLANAPAAVRGSPIGREVVAGAQLLGGQLDRVLARIERIRAQGGDITFSARGLDVILNRLDRVAEETRGLTAAPIDATKFTLGRPQSQPRGLGLFGSQAGTDVERALSRARQASEEFGRLPASAQQGLSGLASIAARVANNVEAGTSAAADLEAVLDRLIPKIKEAGSAPPPIDATKFTLGRPQSQPRGLGLFGSQAGTDVERALSRARQASEEFGRLPASAQQGLSGLASIAARVANNVEAGTSAAADLEAVLDRLIPKIKEAGSAPPPIDVGSLRARAASTLLSINTQESDLLTNQGLATPLTGNRNPRTQVLSQLRGEIETTRRLIGDLSDPLRGELGPEIDRIRNQFGDLAQSGIRVSADEARLLAREVAAINASLSNRRDISRQFSQRFGGAGAAGLGVGVDQKSLNAVGGQIEFVQNKLSGLAAEARGPVLNALQRFRSEAQRLFRGGTINTEEGRRELARLRAELAQTLSAAGGGSRRGILRGLNRAGDVARGGFDKLSLGIQQAAFAVEDFFSVTGGLDQRVRAAGNNISQLGFILGGTGGLIAGVGGAIGSQLVVALIKWANAGRTTEDSMKAINDALARQKSLVEELSQAFASLGDSIAQRAFSAGANEANDFKRALDEIKKKQDEIRNQRAFALDERVIRARADVNVAENRLGRASTRDEAVAAQRQLREARDRLRAEEDRVRNRPAISPADAIRSADLLFANARDRNAARAAANAAVTGGGAGAAMGARQIEFNAGEQRRQDVASRLAGQQDPIAIRNLLRAEQARATQAGDTRLAAQLEELINSLEEPIARATDALTTSIFSGAEDVGRSLERSRAVIDDALGAGIPGVRGFEQQVAQAGEAIQSAIRQLEESLKIEDQDARRSAVEAARQTVDAARQQANALAEQSKNIQAATDSVTRFKEAIDAVTQSAEANVSAARSRQEQARQEFLIRPTQRGERALARAEQDVQRQQVFRNAVRREAALAEERARQDPQTQAGERRIREIDRLLQATGVLRSGERERLIAERESIRAENERRVQRSVDNDPRLRAASDAATREEQRQQAVAAGLDLLLTESQAARLELDKQLSQVREAEAQLVAEAAARGDNAAIPRIQQQAEEAQRRLTDEAARRQAPTIFGLADAVQNAILQGPSRAALTPTDVSTVEGSRELTRLLRGDDAARNQDLVQLQREANRLLDIIAKGGPEVAN